MKTVMAHLLYCRKTLKGQISRKLLEKLAIDTWMATDVLKATRLSSYRVTDNTGQQGGHHHGLHCRVVLVSLKFLCPVFLFYERELTLASWQP